MMGNCFHLGFLRELPVQLIFAYLCMSAASKTPGVSILPWDYSAAAGEQSGEFP